MTTPAPAKPKRQPIPKITDVAIDVLNERHWTQGQLQDAAGQVCIRGALQVARVRLEKYMPLAATVAKYQDADAAVLQTIQQTEPTCQSMEDWNDMWATDVEDVIGVLRRAGEYLVADDVRSVNQRLADLMRQVTGCKPGV
jgi:hypothetical protein